ncbi:laccase-25-like isoform X2 [Lolium rigidum]|uniref:laccase-25-like isoform X2 n=1 Tax=Lolium rigidum TaxID=89674 RepID=UPI001F5DDDCA|nr:laccase-25-like isoform X2 [Lolium rigidum]
MARRLSSLLLFALALLIASVADAAVVEHTFNVGNLSISQLCQPDMIITAVNGQLPGPTIQASEGDTVVVHLVNESPYRMTIHWHGIFQRGTPWADGPTMVTQCPVRQGGNYTYRFNVTGQEGTLWWHAHISFLRATVYGALVILPRAGAGAYPFPKPDKEEILMFGEWWNANVYDLHETAFLTGQPAGPANAYTINGKPGDLYNCSAPNQTHKIEVRQNETTLLRIINAALNTPLFFKVKDHTFTVVAADACYTTPYKTDVVVTAPGQTVDALVVADAAAGRYYMAVSPYDSAIPGNPAFSMTTGTAVLEYVGAGNATVPPVLPPQPDYNDTATAYKFLSNLTALVLPGRPTVPLDVDTRMFVTVGLGVSDCQPEQTMCNRSEGPVFSSSMNNASFVLPRATSMLEAHYGGASAGVYTRDFPDRPPIVFDYTSAASDNDTMQYTEKSTKVKTLKYNATVEMVLQNTALIAKESHPMHLHGFNFFVLAQGFGNYNETAAVSQFNLVNPQERNTVAVPTGGWAVIRFVADNPGMWYMHCHFDAHLDLGLGMVFEVQNGTTADTSVPPPPRDLPLC